MTNFIVIPNLFLYIVISNRNNKKQLYPITIFEQLFFAQNKEELTIKQIYKS
jgi:hypothetical protein